MKHLGLPSQLSWYEHTQASILKGIGRVNKNLLFVRLGENIEKNKSFVASLPLSSFQDQLDDLEHYRTQQNSGNTTIYNVLLSSGGYRKLGFSVHEMPGDQAFRAGHNSRLDRLSDISEKIEAVYNESLDIMLIISNDDIQSLQESTDKLIDLLTSQLGNKALLHVENGFIMKNVRGKAVGHFGYEDGKSQPVFMKSEIDHLQDKSSRFDPSAPKELVLTADPNSELGFGSYLVYRKYEQHVHTYFSEVQRLSAELDIPFESVARQIMGWDRNGKPAVEGHGEHDNDFNYDDDFRGTQCPFHAHARKINQRKFGLERDWRLVRRSVSYGNRDTDFSNNSTENKTDNGSGLLFMAYMNNIQNQFEQIQMGLANNRDSEEIRTGIDLLIGNGSDRKVKWNTENGQTESTIAPLTSLRGGEYFFAPSVHFLKSFSTSQKSKYPIGNPSTKATQQLRDGLLERAFENRKSEWLTDEQLPNIFKTYQGLESRSVMYRRAVAFSELLKTMSCEEVGQATGLYHIEKGELVVGNLPMGSVGLGKKFPKYLTEEEEQASSFCNRDETSVFGHTVPNFDRVIKKGLSAYVKELEQSKTTDNEDFYESVILCCRSVIDYASRFAELASKSAKGCVEEKDKERFERIAEICGKIPAKPAETFLEAVQAIYFLHLAQSVDCVFNSLGRLDQVLNSYLQADLISGRETIESAQEILECFLIKCAHRLNSNPMHLMDQDNLNYGTGIGTRPIYLDQVASCNNFIQNIIVGGLGKDKKDATNQCTHLFLKATAATGLCTPTLNVRVHKDSPEDLLEQIEETMKTNKAGLPIIYNDDAIIAGLINNGIPEKEAYDYCNAGCWEMVMNGKSTFTFGMVNMLTVLECALNEGCKYSSDRQFLRGIKNSKRTPHVNEMKSFDSLMSAVNEHIEFFANNIGLSIANFFLLPNAVSTSPLLSLLLDGCIERGKDQTLGGADHNIGGYLAFAIPNLANSLAAIKYLVFDTNTYSLAQVLEALKANFGNGVVRAEYQSDIGDDLEKKSLYRKMQRDFLFTVDKFGNDKDEVDLITRQILDYWYAACQRSVKFVQKAYLPDSDSEESMKLRRMANYYGPTLKDSLGEDFDILFTYGSGTFGQYSSMGKGVNASADGRLANAPVSPNFSPYSGTAISGLGNVFKSVSKMGLDRFGGGVVTDIRVDGVNHPNGYFADIVRNWVASNGNILTVSSLSTLDIREAERLGREVRLGNKPVDDLQQYSHLQCRVGGWNSFFITLPPEQQKDQTQRTLWN